MHGEWKPAWLPNSKWGPALLPAPTLRPLGLVSSCLASALPRWSVIADVHAPCGFARRSALCAWWACGWMPSGARSPWAAADPCFRTRSRRYPSFRLSAPVECQALLRRSGLPRLFRVLFQAVRKKPSVGVSPLSGSSLPTWLSPGRTNAAVRRGEMLLAILVFTASRWMEAEACPRAVPWKTMPFRIPFPITKAAVSRIRRSARRCLPVGYAANYPCSYRCALNPENSEVWALNFGVRALSTIKSCACCSSRASKKCGSYPQPPHLSVDSYCAAPKRSTWCCVPTLSAPRPLILSLSKDVALDQHPSTGSG